MSRHPARFALGLCAAVAAFGCEASLEGPPPQVSRVAPALTCPGETVRISGPGLAPLPVNLLEAPRLEMPTLTLTLTADLTGQSQSGAATPIEGVRAEGGDLTWTPPSGLDLGVYDLSATVPSGSAARRPDALALIDRPRLDDATCEGDRAGLTLTGDRFVVLGGEPPAVQIGALALEPAMADCEALASPAEGLLCQTLEVDLNGVDTSAGILDVQVNNPAGADCGPSTTLTVEVTGGGCRVTDVKDPPDGNNDTVNNNAPCPDGGALNACGGCAALDAQPGEVCQECGAYVCDGEDAVVCDPLEDPTCGGGTCEADQCVSGACEGEPALACLGALDCAGSCNACGGGDGCCAETCTDCRSCNGGCPCAYTCGGATCDAACGNGSTCGMDATGDAEATLSCGNNATCFLDCGEDGSCALDCGNNATCEVRCAGDATCQLSCGANAACLLRCDPDPGGCDLTRCGNPTDCGSGVVACGRACP